MRFPVAVMLVAFGYAVAYYGVSKFVEYRPSETTTLLHSAVAPLAVLLGVKLSGAQGGTNKVPFTLTVPGDVAQPATNNSSGNTSNGGVQNV